MPGAMRQGALSNVEPSLSPSVCQCLHALAQKRCIVGLWIWLVAAEH